MFSALAAVVVGFFGLIWSADRFVAGAAAIARNAGMAPIMIGLTIVAFGTSAPEIIVSASAAISGASELAIGNALGSNLANIGLVLGVTAVIAPIPIANTQLRREVPILLVATLGAAICLYDNELAPVDGALLLFGLAVIIYFLVQSKAHQPDAAKEADVEHIPRMPVTKAWTLFFVGLFLLVASSQVLIWGAKEIALTLGISELVIGLTIVAVGTSLPELAATLASALKGHHDIAIGNVIGSNLFNLLAVMAMPALIQPTPLVPAVFQRDYLAMTLLTLLLAAILYAHKGWSILSRNPALAQRHLHLGRIAGVLLIGAYAAYYYLLFPATP